MVERGWGGKRVGERMGEVGRSTARGGRGYGIEGERGEGWRQGERKKSAGKGGGGLRSFSNNKIFL